MNSERPTEHATKTPAQVRIGPVAVARLSRPQAIEQLLARVPDGPPLRVAFANAHGLLLAMDNPEFAQTLEGFLVLNDGIGAEIGAKLLTGEGFPGNLNGTDFIPALLAAAPSKTRVYLLGAKPDIVARAAERFALTHENIVICGHRDGYFSPDDHAEIVAGINAAAPDILLVAMGNPKQEYLIEALSPSLDVPLALGVGALFDFTAGEVTRAPGILRRLGLEWVFRFAQEPKRLGGRYTLGIVRYLLKIGGLWLGAKRARA